MSQCIRKISCVALLLGASAMTHAQSGITAITFTDTAMSATGSWPIVPAPNYWSIAAILTDASHHPIGALSPQVTLNTASAASYPKGFRVTLGEKTPANAIVVVYRSSNPFTVGDTVEKAEYAGLCPTGCVTGDLIVPISGELLNSDFTAGASALPVKLQSYDVE